MSTLEGILLFTFIGSIGALIGGIVLLSNKNLITKASHYLASFAAGTLIGAAFFDLLPEAMEASDDSSIFPWVVVGIITFFLIERYLHSFHHHEGHHEHQREAKTTVPLIIIGDTVHNFVDGVAIAATFMVDTSVGMVTALAIFAHEVPQEIGDFGLLAHKGVTRARIIIINVISAASAFAGAIITYVLGGALEKYIPVLITLTAGFFLYIALSDLIPEIQYEKSKRKSTIQTLLMISGIILIWFTVNVIAHE